MLIIPAIDLINGKCVRLTEGDFNQQITYNNDPLKVAFKFKEAGAKRIHIVDLDGAKTGISVNRSVIKLIKKTTGLIVETGGGIRKEEDITELIDNGVDYLILGTILVENLNAVEKWITKYGNKFIAGIDVKKNKVMTKGWTKDEGLDAFEFGKRIKEIGFYDSIFTDISKDGKLEGPNINGTKDFIEKTGLNVILSGGITSNNNIEEAQKIESCGLKGVIIGKALYEGKIDLQNTIKEYQE